jgi:hypothetical protein
MCTDNSSCQQVACLEKVHEEILYVLECLVEDYTGEARRELGDIMTKDFYKELHALYQVHIEAAINRIVKRLIHDSYDKEARSWLVQLRRQIRNTMTMLQSQGKLYSYADAIE